jgi:hypothetical protein
MSISKVGRSGRRKTGGQTAAFRHRGNIPHE